MSNYTECPSCGTEIPKTAKKCSFCGVRLKKPFYKKGWFTFLIFLCLIGGAGYVGKVHFGLDYLQLAKQGGDWLHNVIVSDTDSQAPDAAKDPVEETPNPEDQTLIEPEQPAAEPEKPAQEPEQPASEPAGVETDGDVVVCTAAEITRTYENNVLAGNLDYRGKTCRISGTIKTFGELGDRSYVVLNGWNSGSLVGVRCFVDSLEDVKTLAGMKMGQKLTIEGVCVGLSVNVDIEEAHIAEGNISAETENSVQPNNAFKNQQETETTPEEVEAPVQNEGDSEPGTLPQPTEAQNHFAPRQASR